jgi:Integrase core domain.
LLDFLLNDHAKNKGINLYRSYIRYRFYAKEAHPAYDPVARKTFTKRLESLPKHLIAFSRGGKRLANAAKESTDPEQRALSASLPWQRCAIDHYCADIYLIFFDDGHTPRVLRPWVTAMIDLATHRVIAYSISFRSPSRRSLCMVLRDCVRRHGRLPGEIIFDRGSEFKSVYFFSLLSHYRVDYMLRPASFSKYGGEVESLFRDFKSMWLCQREGNLADYREARAVDGKYKPRNCAVMSIRDFYIELESFIAWRDSRPRVGEIESPTVSFLKIQEEFPFIGVQVEYDGTLMLTTAVETQDYSINYQRGIYLNGRWYYSPDIKKIKGKKSEFSVRLDPENPCLIYGLIDKQWVNLSSSHINQFSAYDLLTQRIQGLLVTELYNEQSKIKQEADESLVKIIQDLSETKGSLGKPQFAEISVSQESEEMTIFEKLKGSKFRRIEPENWEVGHAFKA